jgi:hypothetical protein
LYFVNTKFSLFSINKLNILTAFCKYHPPLSLKSIINHSVFISSIIAFSNSLSVSSQNILIAIYHKFVSSINLKSIEGIFILHLIISFSKTSFSHSLNIFNLTNVQLFHFILSTLSYKSKSFKIIQFASNIISSFKRPYSLAGEPFNILSIVTHNNDFSTTAHIHSKSQDNVSLNFFVSSAVINSECLSHKE